MKLEKIIDIFNDTTGSNLVVIRREESVSLFAPSLKRYWIELTSTESQEFNLTVSKCSIHNVTEELEYEVINNLLNMLWLRS